MRTQFSDLLGSDHKSPVPGDHEEQKNRNYRIEVLDAGMISYATPSTTTGALVFEVF